MLALPPAPLPAGEAKGLRKVVADGVGSTREEALKDAFRSAVRQAVGAVVEAETVLQGERVISDRVLDYSGGVVRTYKELEARQEGGLWRVRVAAVVERRVPPTRLRQPPVTAGAVRGQDIAAEALTRREAREKAAALLGEVLADLPNVLAARARQPRAADYDECRAELRLDVTVVADPRRYEAFAKRLLPVLGAVSLGKGSLLLRAGAVPPALAAHQFPGPAPGEAGLSLGRTLPRPGFLDQVVPGGDEGCWYAWVLAGADPRWARLRWHAFRLDADLESVARALGGSLVLEVSLLGRGGEPVAEQEEPLPFQAVAAARRGGAPRRPQGAGPGWLAVPRAGGRASPKAPQARHLLVAPLLMRADYLAYRGRYYGSVAFKPAESYRLRLKVSQAQLRRLVEVRCWVAFRLARGSRPGPTAPIPGAQRRPYVKGAPRRCFLCLSEV
jgi:hypothetical protein